MAEFLGKHVSDEQVDMIVKHCSFENMRQNNSVNYEWFKDYGVANKGVQFMRKGENVLEHSCITNLHKISNQDLLTE